jgi:hypothetical protein
MREEKDVEAGEAARLQAKREANRKGLKDAVDAGAIPPGANPWFQKGWRRQQQRLAAEDYEQQLHAAYAQSDVKNSDDPEALGSFVDGFTQKYIEDRQLSEAGGSDFNQVFVPMMQQAQHGLYNIHTTQRIQKIEQEVEQNTQKEIGNSLTDHFLNGTPIEAVGSKISSVLEEQYKNGLDGTKANKLAVDAITANAVENLDPSMLDALDHIKTGSGNLGDITYAKDQRRQAEAQIYSLYHQRREADQAKAKLEQEKATQAIYSSATKKLLADPTADISDELKGLSDINPEKVETVQNWKQAAINNINKQTPDNPQAALPLQAKVYAGAATSDDIMDEWSRGNISYETAQKLIGDVDKARDFRNPTRDGVIVDMAKNLEGAIRGNQFDFDGSKGVKAARASAAFYQGVFKFGQAHPNALQSEINAEAQKLQEQLFKLYMPDEAKDSTATGMNPENAGLVAPEAVDWQSQVIYDKPSLAKDLAEFQATQGKSGRLVALAARWGTDPLTLAKAQRALLDKPTAQPSTSPEPPKGK